MPLPSTGARPSPIDRLRVRVERVHPELWTVGKYLAVGATGVVVNLLTFSAARDVLGSSAEWALVASTIAFGVATVWNFVWNYLWTFRSQHSRTVVAHGIGFAAASLAALAINLAVLYVLVSHVDALIAQFCGILSGTAVSFSLNRWANFVRPESPTVLPKDGSSRR
jgi:putative flippase GtrA